jgi:hypothetical protein
MATIINNPATTERESGSGMGVIIGIILVLLVAFLFLYYLLPVLQNAGRATSPTVQVPDKINVNVQTPDTQQK